MWKPVLIVRTVVFSLLLGAISALTVVPASAQSSLPEDLFAFSAGARFVEKPADADYADMAYTPYALIDETASTDTRAEGSKVATYVLELPEQIEIATIAFDTGGMANPDKSVRHNEAACRRLLLHFLAMVALPPTSAADRNLHSRRLCPAGSFLGDFRTPPGARNSSRLQTVRLWRRIQ